jgi:hypothetical protein
MAEEQEQQVASNEAESNEQVESLKRSIDALERKNHELIGKLQKKELIGEVPDDYLALKEFKRNAEQADLEQQGKYSEARQALEQQFREATAEKDKRISELEQRVRELEILSPAAVALRDVVHDPDMILNTQILKDQIEREADGTVVVVKGYERTPIAEWAKTLPTWMQKQPTPQGSGAPIGRSTGEIPAGISNPFLPESYNLTEQSRLFKTDRDLYERLKAQAVR